MTEGTIFLLGPLDFEKQSMYHLSLLAIVSILLLFNHMRWTREAYMLIYGSLSRWSSFNAQFSLDLASIFMA